VKPAKRGHLQDLVKLSSPEKYLIFSEGRIDRASHIGDLATLSFLDWCPLYWGSLLTCFTVQYKYQATLKPLLNSHPGDQIGGCTKQVAVDGTDYIQEIRCRGQETDWMHKAGGHSRQVTFMSGSTVHINKNK
jgi:hypothetical protein